MTSICIIELEWPDKNPGSVLDYAIDLSQDLLTGENAVGMAAMVRPSGPGELQISGHSPPAYPQDEMATVWLAGGIAGRSYLIQVDVYTDQGRTYEYLVTLNINDTLAPSPLVPPESDDFGIQATWGLTFAEMAVAGAGTFAVAD